MDGGSDGFREGFYGLLEDGVGFGAFFPPEADGALGDGFFGVGDEEGVFGFEYGAEAVAALAGAFDAVEGE